MKPTADNYYDTTCCSLKTGSLRKEKASLKCNINPFTTILY
jgi:hypothetical protein